MGRMSKYGLKIAVQYGKKLKKFKNIAEAEDYFFSYKDSLLSKLESICRQNSDFMPDYTVGSLKKIEKWYFALYEKNEFDKLGCTQDEFESIMSVYFGEVVVRNKEEAQWVVTEYPFAQTKYELMVNHKLLSMSFFNMFRDLYKRQNNKRRNLLFREYNKYFVRQ